MKKLLYVTAFPPNNRSGGQQYSLNAIKDLSTKYKVDLIYFTYPGHQYIPVDGVNVVANFDPSKVNCLLHPKYYPLFTRRLNKECLKLLRTHSAEYDVLYFDFSQVAVYSKYVEHPCKVIRCHDIIGQKFERSGSKLTGWIKRSEKEILKSANEVFVPSPKDRDLLEDLYEIKSEYTHEYLHEFTLDENLKIEDRFIFFGLWSRKENLDGLIWFIENVLPLDKEKHKYVVMGGGLSDEINEKYLKSNNIEYLGFVEDSITELAKSKAAIVPLFQGAGIKVKVLDSFTAGTPVIGTNVAFEGIPEIEGLKYQAETCDEFAAQVNRIESTSISQRKENIKNFRSLYNNRHLVDFL